MDKHITEMNNSFNSQQRADLARERIASNVAIPKVSSFLRVKEEWRDVKGYNGLYQVSNYGRIKSFKRKKIKILFPSISNRGYLRLGLTKVNRKTFCIHRLVAQAFIKNIKNKPYINHIDNDPKNNYSKNLEWCNQKENLIHYFKLQKEIYVR